MQDTAELTRSARGKLFLSQVQLAKLLGVHPMTVSRWERGILAPSAYQIEFLEVFKRAEVKVPLLYRWVGACAQPYEVTNALYLILKSAFDFAWRPVSKAQKVGDLRVALGLKQFQLASLMGVSEEVIRDWEHGGAISNRHYQRLKVFQRAVRRVPTIGDQLSRSKDIEFVMYQLFHAAYGQGKVNPYA